jgi:hypothetical protein
VAGKKLPSPFAEVVLHALQKSVDRPYLGLEQVHAEALRFLDQVPLSLLQEALSSDTATLPELAAGAPTPDYFRECFLASIRRMVYVWVVSTAPIAQANGVFEELVRLVHLDGGDRGVSLQDSVTWEELGTAYAQVGRPTVAAWLKTISDPLPAGAFLRSEVPLPTAALGLNWQELQRITRLCSEAGDSAGGSALIVGSEKTPKKSLPAIVGLPVATAQPLVGPSWVWANLLRYGGSADTATTHRMAGTMQSMQVVVQALARSASASSPPGSSDQGVGSVGASGFKGWHGQGQKPWQKKQQVSGPRKEAPIGDKAEGQGKAAAPKPSKNG